MNFDDLLAEANQRLKAQKARITIDCRGEILSLRGTFPPRTGQGKPTQGRIPLNLSATPKNLALAESKAIQIRSLLDAGTFDWDNYITIEPEPEQPQTIAELITEFEADYFNRRARTPKSEYTWKADYLIVFKKLPGHKRLTPQVIKSSILSTTPDSKSRKRFCFALGALARFAKVDFDTTLYSGNYGIHSTMQRCIPTDDEIVTTFGEIENPGWRWVFAMIATYGLRPHEVFRLDYDAIANGNEIIQVLGGKTGSRLVFPVYPRWYKDFNLKRVKLPNVNRKRPNKDVGHEVTQKFWRLKIGIRPYDLRHAWAIRSLMDGLDVAMAAQQMGHSLQLHTKLYHKWIQEHHYHQAYKQYTQRSQNHDL